MTKMGFSDHDKVRAQMAFARRTPDEAGAPAATPTGFDAPMITHDVTVHNARSIADGPSLDRQGFVLVKHEVSCAKERNPEIMRKRYLEEMTPFIKEYFSASWVTPMAVGGVTLRSLAGSANEALVRNYAAGYAHIDFSPVAGPMIAAMDNQKQGLEIRAYSRLMIIQAWRALSPPPQDFPLAFCDASSIAGTDLLEIHYNRWNLSHKAWILRYNSEQRWYYFPNMTPDELVLFTAYDSNEHYKARSAHSAFDNRAAHPNAKPRESVEARFYVYYE